MINIENIREKLENLFNGVDTQSGNVSPINEKYSFRVASQGFELKNIYDMQSGKNFIPVFVSLSSGEISPIPNLKEIDLTTEVVVYFPVRFKQDFYTYFTEFLLDTFVAKQLDFGGENALCNISVANYGEIETNAVREFQTWLTNTYKKPITVSEQWMSMTFNLYISSYNDLGKENGIVLSNDAKVILSFTYNGRKYTDEKPIFTQTSASSNSTPASEQILGERTTKGVPRNTAFGSGIMVYIKKTDFYTTLLREVYSYKKAQDFVVDFEIVVGEEQEEMLIYYQKCYCSSSSVNFQIGEPITISFDFGEHK